MTEAGIFKTNRNQAIRLPKQLAFPEGVTRRHTLTAPTAHQHP